LGFERITLNFRDSLSHNILNKVIKAKVGIKTLPTLAGLALVNHKDCPIQI
jgi:hypothetical protein